MRVWQFAKILAAVLVAAPTITWASPEAPSTPEELEADRAYIRELNLRELAYVRRRDAERERQQQAGDEARAQYEQAFDDYVRNQADYLRKRNAYEGALDNYAAQRLSYENRMADWRRRLAACEAINGAACGQ